MAIGGQVVKVALQADVGGFVRNFAQADTAAGKFGASLSGAVNVATAVGGAVDALAQKAVSAAKKLAGIGVATTLSFAGMGVAAAQFETRLKNIQSLGGEDPLGQFQQNFSTVLDLSRQFPKSANDIAEGLYNITSSGFTGADALEVLRVSLMAASAGMTTTENATTAIAAVLNAYGLGAGKARDVSDALFQTVNLGVLRFEDLTGVLGDSVGMASSAGVSYAELGSAIATMTLSGISAAESGTSLNRVVQSLVDPSESLGSALKAMGFESGVAAIHALGLHGVIEKLRVASQGNIETLLRWFPEIRAARGAMALMSAEGQNYARVAGEIENAQARAGATQRAFNAQSEATSVSFAKFVNGLKAAAIEMGSAFLPPAKLILDILTSLTDAFGDIPGPLKSVIAYLGLFSGALLALGGIYLAFQLKSAVINVALSAMGRGLQTVGDRAGTAGARWSSFGQTLERSTGPFRVTRLAFSGLSGIVTSFGTGLDNLGLKTTTAANNMQRGGGIVRFFGTSLQAASRGADLATSAVGRLGTGAARLLTALPAIATVAIAVFATIRSSAAAAEEMVGNLTSGLNKLDPTSVGATLDKIRDKQAEVSKSLNRSDTAGGLFDETLDNIKELTNFIGIDWAKHSSFDEWANESELSKSERRILEQGHNLQRNVTAIWNQMHPGQAGVSILNLNSQEVSDYALIARKAGIDLTKSFDDSGPARQRAADEVKRISAFMGGMGIDAQNVTEAMIGQFQKLTEAESKAGEGASKAFASSFDLLKTVDPKAMFPDTEELIPIGTQITAFYENAFAKATAFYGGIEDLQRRGADPSVIQKFLQAGPEAAGAVVQAAVEDSTNGLIAVLNNGEKMLAAFQQRAAEMARLTQRAISDPTDKLTKELPQAQQITNEMFSQGKFASIQSVAAALSMDDKSVKSIVGDFGISLAEAVNSATLLPAGPFKGGLEALRGSLNELYNGIVQFSGATPQQAATMIQNLSRVLGMPEITKNEISAKRLAVADMMNTIKEFQGIEPGEKLFIMKILGDEVVKGRIADFFAQPFVAQTFGGGERTQQISEFLMSVVGDEEAISKVQAFAVSIEATPEEWSTFLRLLGTDEAKTKADEVDSAIKLLRDKDIAVTMDNVDAIVKAEEVKAKVATVEGKEITLGVNINGEADLDRVLSKMNSASDRQVAVNVLAQYQVEAPSAQGSIFSGLGVKKFGSGGEMHVAQFAKGAWPARVWAEPETGGESYIPWATSKRARATKILGMTAGGFGYDLVPRGAMAGAMVGASSSRTINVNTSLVIRDVNGDEALIDAIHDAIDFRDNKVDMALRRGRSGS